jgi:hypothetical protein
MTPCIKEYQAAILDYTKGIAQGCEDTLCGAYEYRANVYLKLHDYPHAISDFGHAIRNYLAGTIFGFNIDQYRSRSGALKFLKNIILLPDCGQFVPGASFVLHEPGSDELIAAVLTSECHLVSATPPKFASCPATRDTASAACSCKLPPAPCAP